MHGLFFDSPLSTAAEDKYFLSVRCRNQPYLQPFVHLLPVFAQQLALELPQGVLRRAQDVASCARPQKLDILLAHQASVHNPHATDTPDRKSTRLNSSHRCISYAVFCLKKKKKKK